MVLHLGSSSSNDDNYQQYESILQFYVSTKRNEHNSNKLEKRIFLLM